MRMWVTSCVALALAGCAWFGFAPAMTVHATRLEAVRAGTAVFRQFDIPVEREDPRRGRVSSGRFEVAGFWGGEPVANRVNCGNDGGTPRAERGIVELEVELEVESRLERETEYPYGDPTRMAPAGMDPRREAAQVRIRSRGKVTTPEGKRHGCTLSTEFSQRIVQQIALRTGGAAMAP